MLTSDKDLDKYDVTLYETNAPSFWLVTASFDDRARLSICSGGTGDERYIIVEKNEINVLSRVLAKTAKPRSKTGDDKIDILQNLRTLFASKKSNPFDDVKSFLENRGVKWKTDVWISSD